MFKDHLQGPVSINTTDHPTGRRTIVPCYLSIAEWSDGRSDGPSCLNSHSKLFIETGACMILLTFSDHCPIELRINADYTINKHFDKTLKLSWTLRMFKRNIKEELYLTLIANRKIRTNLKKLRISAHNLPIKTGRHRRNGKIPLKERKCDMCDGNTVGSEFHTVMSCEALSAAP